MWWKAQNAMHPSSSWFKIMVNTYLDASPVSNQQMVVYTRQKGSILYILSWSSLLLVSTYSMYSHYVLYIKVVSARPEYRVLLHSEDTPPGGRIIIIFCYEYFIFNLKSTEGSNYSNYSNFWRYIPSKPNFLASTNKILIIYSWRAGRTAHLSV